MKTIELGDDDTIQSMNRSDSSNGGIGAYESDARVLNSDDQHSTESAAYPPGGGANASTQTWREFEVESGNGSQERLCEIICDVNIVGNTFAAGAGSTNADIIMRIIRQDDGTEYEKKLLEAGGSGVHSVNHDEDHAREAVTPNLKAGHVYKAELEVVTGCAGATTGGGTADFGQYVDLDAGGVLVNQFEFDF